MLEKLQLAPIATMETAHHDYCYDLTKLIADWNALLATDLQKLKMRRKMSVQKGSATRQRYSRRFVTNVRAHLLNALSKVLSPEQREVGQLEIAVNVSGHPVAMPCAKVHGTANRNDTGRQTFRWGQP